MALDHFHVCVIVDQYMMIVGKKNGGRTEYRAFVGLYCILGQRIFLVDKYSAFPTLEQV
jgi:hypothetical protein